MIKTFTEANCRYWHRSNVLAASRRGVGLSAQPAEALGLSRRQQAPILPASGADTLLPALVPGIRALRLFHLLRHPLPTCRERIEYLQVELPHVHVCQRAP